MKYDPIKILIIMILVLLALPTFAVLAENPQAILNQYISELQKNQNDAVLREKIIKHVQTMKPAPATPEEAKRHLVRGKAAFKGAKEAKDYADAADEFKKALLYAPWLVEGYYNLGIIQDKAGLYADAMQSLKFYLLAAPNAPDAEKVKELIYEIEYRKDKTAKESSPQAIAAKKQKEYEVWLKKIDGRRYTNSGDVPGLLGVLDVKGKVLIKGVWAETWSPIQGPRGYTEHHRYDIDGRTATSPVMSAPAPIGSLQIFYTISEDGDRIVERTRSGSGHTNERIYLWQR